MKCDESRIQLVEIDGRTYGVSGCGQRATYVESCDHVQGWSKTGCAWVKNDESAGDDEDAPRPRKKGKKARSSDSEE
jgi:hypothetical protein